MSNPSTARLLKEFQEILKNPTEGIEASPNNDNLKNWTAVIFGPENTPYEDGIFILKMVFSDLYPGKPPEVRFVSEMFHPNVYSKEEGSKHSPDMTGIICLDIFSSAWSPALGITSILLSIRSLLDSPNPHALRTPNASTALAGGPIRVPRGNRYNKYKYSLTDDPSEIYKSMKLYSAANPEAARLYLRNDGSYAEKVRIIVDKSIEAEEKQH